MKRMKTLEETVKNWKDAIPGAQGRYKQGVSGSGSHWQEEAGSDEAEAEYARKVQEAISKKSRQSGVANTSPGEWEKNTADSAPTWAANSVAKADEFRGGMAPVLNDVDSARQAAHSAHPGKDLESNIARSGEYARQMARLKEQRTA